MRNILLDFLILIVVVTTIMYVYRTFGDDIRVHFFGEHQPTMYVEGTPLSVTVADETDEHKQGLSGVPSLREFEGMLFVFDREDYYGMWMKDMMISLDIIWINNEFQIVHIEENVSPNTYPQSFVSNDPARFVLETNAFFAKNANIVVGDKITAPPSALPGDLITVLQ
jgi:uncharacterized membrane protein (UPF0127 family)